MQSGVRTLFFARLALSSVVLALAGCSFVELEPKAKNIIVAPNTDALNRCTDMGTTSVSLWSRAENLQTPEQIEEQLTILGRNSAAKMGANAIAPASPIVEGQRTYRIYNCSFYQG